MRMFFAIVLFVVSAVPAFAGTVSAGNGWKCTARNIVGASYGGGSQAMIHLSGYSRGGHYRVTKVSSTKVRGTTKNGTSFTCTKS